MTIHVVQKEPGAYQHGDLREALVQAGLKLLAEQGVAGLTLRAAARLAGVSHSAPRRHFRDKAALLAAIAERGFRLLEASIRAEREKVTANDAQAGLIALGIGYVRFATEFPGYFQLIFGPTLQGNKENDSPELAAARLEAYAPLQSEVESGIARGDFRSGDSKLVCLAGWALVHGLSTLLINDALPEYSGEPKLVDFVAETLVRIFGEGVFVQEKPHDRRQSRTSKAKKGRNRNKGPLGVFGAVASL